MTLHPQPSATESKADLFTAIKAKVITRDMDSQPEGKWSFQVIVQAVFKSNSSATGPMSSQEWKPSTIIGLVVSSRDSLCRCPRLRPNR